MFAVSPIGFVGHVRRTAELEQLSVCGAGLVSPVQLLLQEIPPGPRNQGYPASGPPRLCIPACRHRIGVVSTLYAAHVCSEPNWLRGTRQTYCGARATQCVWCRTGISGPTFIAVTTVSNKRDIAI